MMGKKRKPGKQPRQVIVNGKRFWLAVFIIHTKTPNGTPQLCKMIREDQTIELAGGEEFMTAYVPANMIHD